MRTMLRSDTTRKILILAVLLLFLYNTTGYYLLFELRKSQIRKEIRAQMKKKSTEIVTLRIANPEQDPEFKRIHSREFRYRNEMYDILHQKKEGGVTVFYCIHDKKETRLFNSLSRQEHRRMMQFLWDHVIKMACPVTAPESMEAGSCNFSYPPLKVSLPESPPDHPFHPPEDFS